MILFWRAAFCLSRKYGLSWYQCSFFPIGRAFPNRGMATPKREKSNPILEITVTYFLDSMIVSQVYYLHIPTVGWQMKRLPGSVPPSIIYCSWNSEKNETHASSASVFFFLLFHMEPRGNGSKASEMTSFVWGIGTSYHLLQVLTHHQPWFLSWWMSYHCRWSPQDF